MKCSKCLEDLNQMRFNLGYRVCVTCSEEPKWSSVPVINHKTGNEIQIVKDPEVAAEFMAKSARTGFGILKGMSKGYKKLSTPKPTKVLPDKPVVDKVLGTKPMPNEFEAVGFEIMNLMEGNDKQLVYNHIDQALAEKRIYKVHAVQLRQIIDALS
jgi:hypothetical protein